MTNASIAVRPVSATVGAEILGLDLAGSLPAAATDAIRHALMHRITVDGVPLN